jgi:hypothetical protein
VEKTEARRELERIIGEGVGAASTCWETMDGTGVFDSTRAGQIVEEITQAAVSYSETREESFEDKARRYVFEYVKSRLEITDRHITFSLEEVYVVWFCKTLQNWKCCISTTLPDGMYYEVTHDGDKKKTYVDAYKKWNNVTISEGEDSLG